MNPYRTPDPFPYETHKRKARRLWASVILVLFSVMVFVATSLLDTDAWIAYAIWVATAVMGLLAYSLLIRAFTT